MAWRFRKYRFGHHQLGKPMKKRLILIAILLIMIFKGFGQKKKYIFSQIQSITLPALKFDVSAEPKTYILSTLCISQSSIRPSIWFSTNFIIQIQ